MEIIEDFSGYFLYSIGELFRTQQGLFFISDKSQSAIYLVPLGKTDGVEKIDFKHIVDCHIDGMYHNYNKSTSDLTYLDCKTAEESFQSILDKHGITEPQFVYKFIEEEEPIYTSVYKQSNNKTVEEIISYIENDSKIMIPINRFFDENGDHITKKQYGHILIEILCKELREKFLDNNDKIQNNVNL